MSSEASRLEIVYRSPAALRPDPRNSRTHSDAQVEEIRASIRERGFTNPVLLRDDETTLIAGEGRLRASLLEGLAEIPTITLRGLSEAQIRAYAIADNKIALNAGWNEDMLLSELGALKLEGYDLDLTGFSPVDLGKLGLDGYQPDPKVTLLDRFGIAPFSVLNAREGWWQERKKAWLRLGMQSELGRGDNLVGRSLQDRLAIIVPGDYQAAVDFIDKARGEGLDDDEIVASAQRQFGRGRRGGGAETENLKGLTHRTTPDSYRARGRAMGQDLLAEEGGIALDRQPGPWTPGKGARRKPDATPGGGGPNAIVRKRGRKPNAAPAGGGGGWAELNESMARGRAKLQRGASGASAPGGLTFGEMAAQPGHPRGDLPGAGRSRAIGTDSWVNDKIAEGDIASGLASETPGAGTSIFDPVLAEIAYRWFSPHGGVVLDPFAGGSVRGIVAGLLGRDYVGIDLSERQLAANEAQIETVFEPAAGNGAMAPTWLCGDSVDVLGSLGGIECDFVFSCPPYADLEVYSEDRRDLSTMPWPQFVATYERIVKLACERLKPDRFACFVVGEVRGEDGNYRGLVPATIRAFERAGLALYNEGILITAAGSLPIRAGKQFETSRKLGKTHQNVLVFLKGDARQATAAVGPVEFKPMESADEGPLGGEIE